MIGYSHRTRIDVKVRLAAASPSAVADAVAARAARVFNSLGLTSTPALFDVQVLAGRDGDDVSAAPEFLVHDRLCAYDRRIAAVVQRYVGGNLSVPDAEAEFVGLLCQHALTSQPELILSDAVVEEWLRVLDQPLAAADVAAALQTAARVRVSVGHPETIAGEVAGRLTEAIENYIASQVDDTVVVRVSPAFLQELEQVGAADTQFDVMRQGLFDSFGVPCPLILMEACPELRERSFVVVMNALESVPFVGFAPDYIHVNDTVDRLRLMNVEAEAFPSPDSLGMSATAAAAHQALLEKAGLRTLRPLDYIVEAVRAEVSRNLAVLVHRNSMEYLLNQFDNVCPAARRETELFMSVTDISAIVRELVRDRIGVLNLQLILERLMDYRFRASPEARVTVLDDPWLPVVVSADSDDLLSFVRRGLRRQRGYSLSRGTNTLVVYLLDVSILDAVGPIGTALSNTLQAAILQSVDAEMAHLPPTAQRPLFLTTAHAAGRLRNVFRAAYPDQPLVAYDELPADINVQPIARISLGLGE